MTEVTSIFEADLGKVTAKGLIRVGTVTAMRTVRFGRYPYEEDGAVRELEWCVLTREEGKTLLITKDCIDYMKWSTWGEFEEAWKVSSIRSFLNDDFCSVAFTDEERSHIIPTANSVDIRTHEEVDPAKWVICEETVMDRVFLLDPYQADTYFANDEERRSLPTPYTRAKGGSERDDWWLRTLTGRPLYACPYASLVWPEGKISHYGFDCYFEEMIRPVVWVDDAALV